MDRLRRYAAGRDADIRTSHRVTAVTADGDGYAVRTPAQTLHARIVISATVGRRGRWSGCHTGLWYIVMDLSGA